MKRVTANGCAGGRGAAAATLVALALATGHAAAQDPVGEVLHPRLQRAQAALADGRHEEALAELRDIETAALDDTGRALVFQAYGFAHAGRNDHAAAVDYFERSLALDALPADARQAMLYPLAGLYSVTGQYRRAIDTTLEWLPGEESPPAEAHLLLADAYAALEEWREAIPWAQRAIETHAEPPETWHQLLVGIYLEAGDYAGATAALRRMLERWPERFVYWELLSGAYQRAGDDLRAAATLRLAYRKGLLVDPEKILQLVGLMLYVEDPWQAGRLLDVEMRRGRVATTRANLELLLQAWIAAREFDRAIAVVDRLAPLTSDGRYFLRKAEMLAERARWDEVIAAAEQALVRGGLRKPGEAYLLKGMAEAELGRYGDALDSLAEARDYDEVTRRQADGWIGFVRDRMQVAATGTG